MPPRANPFMAADEDPEDWIKAFVYGPWSGGKTWFGLHAPGPIAVIDTESGTERYKRLVKFDRLNTKSQRQMVAALDWIAANPGKYKTLLVDPVTILYDTLQDAALKATTGKAQRKAEAKRYEFDPDSVTLDQPAWGRIKRQYKQVMNGLLSLPCHVIVTAREKDDNEVLADGSVVKRGVKPDAEKSTAYNFDAVFHAVPQGTKRIWTIEKTRGDLGEILPLGTQYTDPTFEGLFGPVLKGVKDKSPSTVRQVSSDDAASSEDAADFGMKTATPDQAAELAVALEAAGYDPEELRLSRSWPAFVEMSAQKVEEMTKWARMKTAAADKPAADQADEAA